MIITNETHFKRAVVREIVRIAAGWVGTKIERVFIEYQALSSNGVRIVPSTAFVDPGGCMMIRLRASQPRESVRTTLEMILRALVRPEHRIYGWESSDVCARRVIETRLADPMVRAVVAEKLGPLDAFLPRGGRA